LFSGQEAESEQERSDCTQEGVTSVNRRSHGSLSFVQSLRSCSDSRYIASVLLPRPRVVLFLVVFLSWTAQAYSQRQDKQQLAEAAADKVIHRFYETLNFADVYREFYVTNPDIRKAEVEIVMQNMIWQGDHWAKPGQVKSRNIDFEALERAYVALGNFHWMAAAAAQTYDGNKKKFENETALVWEKYMTPMNGNTYWPILTGKQLDERLTARFTALANFFKEYVVQTNFDTPEFRQREQRIQESRPPDPIDKLIELFAPAGLKDTDALYVVRRGRFYLYLIEENGAFKMFSWNNRIRD